MYFIDLLEPLAILNVIFLDFRLKYSLISFCAISIYKTMYYFTRYFIQTINEFRGFN